MFKTIGNTWQLIGLSWRVLNEDKRLLLLPLFSGLALLALILVATGVYSVAGAFDRAQGWTAGDYLMGALFYLIATFTVIYFNSALVFVACGRLNGETPTIGDGLAAANDHLPSIFGWSCFATTIGLIIEQLRSGDGLIFKVIGWIVSAIWAYATFFVVPVLVMEGVSPFAALKRSTGLIQDTWGKQLISNWSFFVAYLALFAVALLPLVFAFAISTALGVAVALLFSAPVLIGGVVVLVAMEGIFRAALYLFATGNLTSKAFPEQVLRLAYVGKNDRGSWGDSGAGDYTSRFARD
jgi:hypothetical protein